MAVPVTVLVRVTVSVRVWVQVTVAVGVKVRVGVTVPVEVLEGAVVEDGVGVEVRHMTVTAMVLLDAGPPPLQVAVPWSLTTWQESEALKL